MCPATPTTDTPTTETTATTTRLQSRRGTTKTKIVRAVIDRDRGIRAVRERMKQGNERGCQGVLEIRSCDRSRRQVIKLQRSPSPSQSRSRRVLWLSGYMANVITDFKFINMAQAAAYPESEHNRDRERKRTKRADREIHIQIRAAASRGPPVVLQLRRVQATLDPSTCPSCSSSPLPHSPRSPLCANRYLFLFCCMMNSY